MTGQIRFIFFIFYLPQMILFRARKTAFTLHLKTFPLYNGLQEPRASPLFNAAFCLFVIEKFHFLSDFVDIRATGIVAAKKNLFHPWYIESADNKILWVWKISYYRRSGSFPFSSVRNMRLLRVFCSSVYPEAPAVPVLLPD